MKKFPVIGLLFLILSLNGLCEGATKIRVVASTLDMADFAKQVGGERVEVYAISTGKTDLHFFEPYPSQVMKLQRADLLIVGGLDIDVWIQSLIDAARNPKILFGAPGYVDPSEGIHPIQVPRGRIDGSMGDVHPYGNPHFWFTLDNVQIAVKNITEGLCRICPDGKDYFTKNMTRYLNEVNRTFKELKEKIAPFRGTKVVQYHQSWDYFCSSFGLEIVGSLEPKPGIPPSPAHLEQLIKKMRDEGVKLILVEPYYPEKPIRFVVRETGARALRLPLYLGSKPDISSYLDNLRYNVNSILAALSK